MKTLEKVLFCSKTIGVKQGQFLQNRKAWNWYSFKGLDMDMRSLIFKFFLNHPLIFLGILGSYAEAQKVFKFLFVLNLIWGGSKCVQIALFSPWNDSDSHCLFLMGCLILHIFLNHCSICVLKVAEVVLYRFWTQIEENSVLNLY
jgi:hypothetical protein